MRRPGGAAPGAVRAASWRAERWDRLHLVTARPGPQGRDGTHGVGHRVRRPLVVDPPAQEVGPGIGWVALDREVHLAQVSDALEELVVGQADAHRGVEVFGDLRTERPGDLVEAVEAAAQAQ